MPKLSLTAALLGGAALLLVAGVVLLWTGGDSQDEADAVRSEAPALRRVAMHRVEAVPLVAQTEVSGVLEARRDVALFAETRGRVIEVGAEALDRVAAGQLLVRVDPIQAEVTVERAEAALARTRSELALARSNLERRQSLFEQGVASDAELEDASNAERVAAAALREARAQLTQARDELGKKTIAAPFAGVLRSFSVEEGEYVQDGQRLGELLDISTARLEVGLSDREVVSVRAGQPVEVRLQAYPERRFQGRILRVGAASDERTKRFPVEVELDNPQGALLPGMVARAEVGLGDPRPRTLLPREAALEAFGQRYVFVLEPGEGRYRARRRPVVLRPVPFRPTDLEVVSGLQPGDLVAVSDVRQLRDGEAVAANGAAP